MSYSVAVGTSAKKKGSCWGDRTDQDEGFLPEPEQAVERESPEHSGLDTDCRRDLAAREEAREIETENKPSYSSASLNLILIAPEKNPGNLTPQQWLPDRTGQLGLRLSFHFCGSSLNTYGIFMTKPAS